MKPYRRKLSIEDDDTGSVLITKDRWRDFPPPMQEFAVEVGGRRYVTTIVAEDCACVGEPHQHLHLEATHLRDQLTFAKGALITVEESDGVYRIGNG